MPAITYKEWSGGLDRRIPLSVQDANKLWTLQNAYITLGLKIKKRPGARIRALSLGGTVGLENINGELAVFADTGAGPYAPSPATLYYLDKPPGVLGDLSEVSYAKVFNGFPFVVAHYTTGETRYHYIDGATTYITDVNCPNSRGVTAAASRIFGPDGENVRYCKAGDPRDWTTASDAGFLPAGLQMDTKADVTACGTFQDSLVVFFAENAQIWTVNVDPSANEIKKRIYGVGSESPMSLASFFNDLMFLSPFGFRSMTVQSQTDRIDDTDVGVQIDSLLADFAASFPECMGKWIPQLGQYWAVFNTTGMATVWVYTVSKSSKLTCWSSYNFPWPINGITTVAGTIFLRTNEGTLFQVEASTYIDQRPVFYGGSDEPIAVDVQMAFQDAKSPGVEKMWHGADFVFEGEPTVSYLFDPRDTTRETVGQSIDGDTRTGQLIPVEISSAALAPRFQHSADEAFSLDLATLYFHSLTASA